MTQIEIHSETFQVETYRRNHRRCRDCRKRSGTVILTTAPVAFTFDRDRPFEHQEDVRLLVVCETCGRRWVPSTGPGLRALGR